METEAPAFASLSSQDAAQLHAVAESMLHNWAVAITAIGLYGIILVINGMAFYLLINRRFKLQSTRVLMAALFVVFITHTISTGVLASLNFSQLKGLLIDNPELTFLERFVNFQASDMFTRLFAIEAVLSASDGDLGLVFIISDSLAVWRAIKICTPPAYVGYGFLFLLFSNLVMWLTVISLHMVSLFQETGIIGSQIENNIAIVYYTGSALSIIINILATLMIAFKAYQYRAGLKNSALKFHSGYILVFLAESGVIYVISQIIALSLFAVPGAPGSTAPVVTAGGIWQQFNSAVAAVYTPVIILIVSRNISLVDTMQLNHTSAGSPGNNFQSTNHPVSTLAFASYHSRGNPVGSEAASNTDILPSTEVEGQEKLFVAASHSSV